MPTAIRLILQLPELNLLDAVVDYLGAAEDERRELQQRIAHAWSSASIAKEEIDWRNALAKELRDQARFTSGGSGRVGGDFVSGFNLACNRITAALNERAHQVTVPDYLFPNQEQP
nr:hypothetical protein GCM10010200_026890 [Actinomadura rugatobispora]